MNKADDEQGPETLDMAHIQMKNLMDDAGSA